jgi:hypothetical protein
VAGVQIRCPSSGLWAWTGVDVDPGGWDPSALSGRQLPCKICGDHHTASSRGLRVPPWSENSLQYRPAVSAPAPDPEPEFAPVYETARAI